MAATAAANMEESARGQQGTGLQISRRDQPPGTPRALQEHRVSKPAQDPELKDYQLGDCLGKGAFGSVFRALNMGTGETVAVKQIKLADLPKSELRVITLEIDLLKNLDHPNIVKYHGFVKSSESLNIILEYCENGSLHSISKNFGKFPENLVGLYMSQVLHGLLYLHEQGVIHRDIKGANILTTKQGLVKLADFGVATRTNTLHESSVVGTPYWMAPEVIELSGATTASDIWSLGCTVIELLDGKPPYHKLQPMHALFRIVNDDHPPLPEGASPIVRDFLMQCFQKDHNLRVSARKLLKHPWIVNARRSDSVVPKKPTEYAEAVKSVQQWNEALKSPDSSLRKVPQPSPSSPVPARRERPAITTARCPPPPIKTVARNADQFRATETSSDDNWDDDFASAITPSALQLPHLKPHDHFAGMLSSEKLKTFASVEGGSDDTHGNAFLEGDATVKSPVQLVATDTLQTVRRFHEHSESDMQNGASVKSPRKAASGAGAARPAAGRHILPLKAKTEPASQSRSTKHYREDSAEDYSDLVLANDGAFDKKLAITKKSPSTSSARRSTPKSSKRSLQAPNHGGSLRSQVTPPRKPSMRRTRSEVEIQRYAEDENDEDYSDIFGKDASPIDRQDSEMGSECGTLMLTSKLSNNSWLGDDDDDDDPFAQLEECFDETDLEANVARDKYARLCTQVEALVGSLKVTQPDEVLVDLSEQLLEVLFDSPETKGVIISAHGMLPILEILESCRRRDIIFNLLKTVNLIILGQVEIQENLCFVGGIPIITKYASRKYPSEIRLEAADFVRQMCQSSTLTLQMFVSAGGLKVLVEFLEEDYEEEGDLVLIGVNGVWSVFELQGPTPKNDFCRILSRNSVLDPLSLVLSRILDEDGELARLCEGRIANIFLLFSQAENHVKELVADRTVLHRVLKELKRMSPAHQVTMLKFIKNLSMLSTTLDSLQNSNAIDVLTEILRTSIKEDHFREISNQVLNTIYNLCRLNKARQEDAALNGIIPILMRIFKTERPLKEFALPILCDMAHSGKVGRRELWRNKGLQFYISLLAEPYWQVTALDAIFIWLQEETARVEEHLLDGPFQVSIINTFTTAKANAFENLLEPLQKLLRLSPPVAHSLAHPAFFARTLQKLSSVKALTRLNLLRIVQSICDASDEQGALINLYGLYDSIQRLADNDTAILVRDMASKLIRSCDEYDRPGKVGLSGKNRRMTRRASAATTPPGQLHGSSSASQSMPPTPTSSRSTHSSFFAGGRDRDRGDIRRSMLAGPIPFRATPAASNGGSNHSLSSHIGGGSNDTPNGTPNGSGSSSASTSNGNASMNVPRGSRLPRTTSSRSSRHSVLTPSRDEDILMRSSLAMGNGPNSLSIDQGTIPISRKRRLGGGMDSRTG